MPGSALQYDSGENLDPDCCPREVGRRLELTALGAALAYQLRRRRSMKLLIVLHYNSIETLERLLERLGRLLKTHAGLRLDEADGYAVGGLVPHSSRWWLLALRLQEARRLLGWNTWIHLLGVASPHNIPLLYAAGADSMDSKTYIIAAAKRLYYQPPGTKPARIELRRDTPDKPPCNCPACTQAETLATLRQNTRLLALHNLHITLQAAQKARQAHMENRLNQLLKQLAKTNPKTAKALKQIKHPRPPQKQ